MHALRPTLAALWFACLVGCAGKPAAACKGDVACPQANVAGGKGGDRVSAAADRSSADAAASDASVSSDGGATGPSDATTADAAGADAGTCSPGQLRCAGPSSVDVESCVDGAWKPATPCSVPKRQVCHDGACVDACGLAAKLGWSAGCRAWITDLDNVFIPTGSKGHYDASGAQFVVAVLNPSDALTATFSIADHEGPVKFTSKGDPLDTSPLAPGDVRFLPLPPRNINGSVLAKLAYRLDADAPVTVVQFNPLEANQDSSDASLLLPEHGLGKAYRVMSRMQTFSTLRPFVTVVAVKPGKTQVTVKLSPGAMVTLASSDGVVPVMAGGAGADFVLQQWQTLNIETDKPGADPTGTEVLASQPVAVWSGSEASNVPNTNGCNLSACTGSQVAKGAKCGLCEWDNKTPCAGVQDCIDFNTCCADHLEVQLPPVSAWGSRHALMPFMEKGKEVNVWRVVAASDGTVFKADPTPLDAKGGPVVFPKLDAGEWFEWHTKDAHTLVATGPKDAPAPVLIGHYMVSQSSPFSPIPQPQPGQAGTGDPALSLAVPMAQWDRQVRFLVPGVYGINYISVIAPKTAKVTFDGKLLTKDYFVPLGSSLKATRIFVGSGAHVVEGDVPLTVEVYGYDQYISYAYAGARRL